MIWSQKVNDKKPLAVLWQFRSPRTGHDACMAFQEMGSHSNVDHMQGLTDRSVMPRIQRTNSECSLALNQDPNASERIGIFQFVCCGSAYRYSGSIATHMQITFKTPASNKTSTEEPISVRLE